MVSLLLHGTILAGAAGLWSNHCAGLVPAFQSGEFCLELGPTIRGGIMPMAAAPSAPTALDLKKESELPAATVVESKDELDIGLRTAATQPHHPAASAAVARTANPGVAETPRLKSCIRLIYPHGARLRGEEGVVTVRAFIMPSGKTSAAEVVNSSGFSLLDQAAINAVRRAAFIPIHKKHQPIESEALLTFRFSLLD